MCPTPLAFSVQNHYETLERWWKAHGWAPVPADALPKTGVVVVGGDGAPICAGFLYATDSSLCWLEWVVADPESATETRSAALDVLISSLLFIATERGFKQVFTSARHQRLIGRYEAHFGFIPADTGMTNLIKRL